VVLLNVPVLKSTLEWHAEPTTPPVGLPHLLNEKAPPYDLTTSSESSRLVMAPVA
jgi:hypothetical protein